MLSDHDLAIAAALAGAAVVSAKFGARNARIDKGAGDFATEADLEAERAILGVLRAARPADAVLGEETGHTAGEGTKLSGDAEKRSHPSGHADAGGRGDTGGHGDAGGRGDTGGRSDAGGHGGAGRLWLVDPLCGTLNYATGTRTVAVNVALRVGGRVTAAAVADPFSGEVFWAGDRTGAFVRRHGDDSGLAPVADPALVDLNLDPPLDDGTGARLLAHPGFRRDFRPRVLSTTLAVAWVAAGRRAAYLTAGDLTDSVHFTAGVAICRAAGCVVTALDGGPFGTGAGGLLAAADQATHDRLRALVIDVNAA